MELLLLEGKTHITKNEAKKRRSAEIKLNNQIISADPMVIADKRALEEFEFLAKLYGDIEFVGTLDSHIINQYCMSVAELDDLLYLMRRARDGLHSSDPDATNVAVTDFLAFDMELRQKRAEIVKLSDRLYLNPVARTKSLAPKKEAKEKDPMADMFGDTG